jgi:hypothetical protein
MAGSGGWLGRAWEKGEGDFYRPGSMPRRLLGSVVAYEAKEWARGGGDVRRDRRPMAEGSARGGESAVAAWHRPKPPRVRHTLAHSGGSAGLGPEVTLALGVRAQPGYSEPTWRAGCDVARERALWRPTRFG